MRNYLLFSIIFLAFISCKKDMDSGLETEIIKVTLQGTEIYEYKFSDSHPVEGSYDIRKQAQNFQLSEMRSATYHYQAKEGFRGTEKVEIVLTMSSGDDNFIDQQKWVFNIEVK